MSKVTKKELQYQINGLAAEASTRHNSIMRIHRALASIGVDIFSDDFDLTEPEPQLKQIDQSVFNGLDEKWRFAAVDSDGDIHVYDGNPTLGDYEWVTRVGVEFFFLAHDYDASNWQNSLIERDIAKELLEVDLSSELTGSELCKAMLARGDKFVMCGVSDVSDLDAASNEYDDLVSDAVTDFDCKDGLFGTVSMRWSYAVPINNQGEPLTASEVGL